MTAVTKTPNDQTQLKRVVTELGRRSFCTLATTSAKGRAHVAGVVYQAVDTTLYVHTMETSRKGRSIASNPHVAVCVPVRRLPIGPPFTIHFQATAEILAMNDPHIIELLDEGRLKKIAGHGALDEPDGCFLRITPSGALHTYGIGVPIVGIIRDPLHSGARTVSL